MAGTKVMPVYTEYRTGSGLRPGMERGNPGSREQSFSRLLESEMKKWSGSASGSSPDSVSSLVNSQIRAFIPMHIPLVKVTPKDAARKRKALSPPGV